ncbi:maker686 [Drosophila busckii]|uniref:Maker686 n=1 Tax=Drosophila busckii TaxID=30019 RepID=A0A0M4EIL1_DROBS|nr:uncharacterized protein LOC108599190 [Drosophila busckii]ALC43726.1 maker686 [Drosophila busckii]
MSLIFNTTDTNFKKLNDDEDNESFYSFNSSERDDSDLDALSLSDIENDIETSVAKKHGSVTDGEYEFDTQKLNSAENKTMLRTAQAPQAAAAAQKLKPEQTTLQRRELRHHMDVTNPMGLKVPADELFDMSLTQGGGKSKNPLETSPGTEALHKYMFTEKWIENQQDCDFDHFAHQTLEEQQKGRINKKTFVDLELNNSVSLKSSSAADAEPYVSPFEDMPAMSEEQRLREQKMCNALPAGFDLTRLTKYRNPNHWHLRASTLNDFKP